MASKRALDDSDVNGIPNKKMKTENKIKYSDYFEITSCAANKRNKSAKCKLCKELKIIAMPNSGTSGLKKHLENIHKHVFNVTETKGYDFGQKSIASMFSKVH